MTLEKGSDPAGVNAVVARVTGAGRDGSAFVVVTGIPLCVLVHRASKVRNKGPKDIMAVEELNGEVKFSTQLPYPNNLSRFRPPNTGPPSLFLQMLSTRGLTAVVQDAAEAAGSAPAADAELGPGAAGRPGQPRDQETAVL